jgi:hypothetical protein
MPNLEEFAENLWMIDGSPIRNFGIPLPTRMIVMKLTNGPLWVNSPVSTPTKELDRIKALGPVRYLVAPTQLHLWRLEECQDSFPVHNESLIVGCFDLSCILLAANTADCILKHLQFPCEPDQRIAKLGALFN